MNTDSRSLGSGLASFVRRGRERLGFNGVQFAERAGLTKGELSAIETGKVALPGASKRRSLAEALGVRHVDVLIAAGELAADEIPVEGAVREPFPPGDPRAAILAALEEVNPARPEVAFYLKGIEQTVRELAREKPFSAGKD